jgi:hypothetical protein
VLSREQAAAADKLQAEHLRRCLGAERADLAEKIGAHARILNKLNTSEHRHAVTHRRRCIRGLEAEIHAIDKMVDALDRRFADQTVRRRA